MLQQRKDRTSKAGPEPVVIAVEEPIQDPGEDCAVVVGRRLLLSLRRQTDARKGEEERGGEESNGRC